jgi:tRNA threonylcarbamoyladenosine biosynthesis protein TsaB
MLILSLNVATNGCAAAFLRDGQVLSLVFKECTVGQAEALIPMILQAAEKAGCSLKQADKIAVARGPGSFTGVRIALAAAKGIGLALNKPVVGVTNFEAGAYGLKKEAWIVLESKREDYYVQLFDKNGKKLTEPAIKTAEQMEEFLPFNASGDGARRLKEELEQKGLGDKITLLSAYDKSGAVAIGLLALEKEESTLSTEPVYLRPADVTLKETVSKGE